ncbi:putative leucine-rich repeat extensin-like protein 2 [Iris pallida]|uniref:Leucine-rich repeat extensin-like protein 2 n=1 Tax=Iris pallida TaxID=29817 RepID=A0AAX6DJL0_IRIPA|nr:putative leucine-rich repeat extensin-like protein 2 [Iris pallida]
MDPAISAGTGTGGGGGSSYPDSVDSSPRSRGGESWDEPSYSSSPKLRLMCSYGGRIVPRPTDKSLCYLGGDTRIVVVDRNSSLSDFSSKLSRSLLGGRPFSLKYQLPNEDLDSLISVTTDEDLDIMIEEYDRVAAAANPGAVGPTKRLRLFLFPSKPESAPSSIGSLLDDSKSEAWFVDALNGDIGTGIDDLPRGMSADSASVNCLLGLEDDSSVHSRAGPAGGGGGVGGRAPGGGGGLQHADPLFPGPDSSGKLTRPDVQSVPDSPMLDTTSSFGSASSAPSLSNLPPIRVRPDDRPPDPRYANIEDHFVQMNLQSATTTAASAVPRPEEPLKGPSAPPAQTIPLPTAPSSTPPTENPRPGVPGSEDDKPEARKPPPLSAAPNQKPVPVEAPIPDRPVYYQERIPMATAAGNPISDLKREIPVSDPAYRMQTVSAIPLPEQMHPQTHLLQQQQQQQHPQQFVHGNPNYVQVLSYYHQVPHPMQQSQQFDQQIPMYYLPVRQNPQPPPAAAVPLSKLAPKTEMATNIYRTAAPPAPMVHMVPPTAKDQGQLYNHMGYHVMHHHHPSQAAQVANYGYEYANAVATATPDQLHPQVYYTQATSPPPMPGQYQTVVQEENKKQNRGS